MCLQTQSGIRDYAVAGRLAEEQLLMLRMEGITDYESTLGGVFEKPYQTYSWSARVQPAGEGAFTFVSLKIWRGEKRNLVYNVQTLLSTAS